MYSPFDVSLFTFHVQVKSTLNGKVSADKAECQIFFTCRHIRMTKGSVQHFLVPLRQIIIMKNPAILFCALSLCVIIISCGFPGGSISIKHSEYSHYYEMTAKFNPDKTAAVERWLDQELSAGDMSFANTEIDGNITLDDKSVFYIKKSPGFLNIKLDKEKNSDATYKKLRSVCEGINDVVR